MLNKIQSSKKLQRRPIRNGLAGKVLLLTLVTGCSSFEAPRPGESELIKWIEFTHDVCEAIQENESET